MGSKSQRKGRGGELEICRILQAHGIPAAPGKPVSFGETPDITGIRGVHAEVKRTERLNIQEAMNQAIRDSEKFNDGMPVLFHRRNRSPWLATMRLTDWMRLYAETIGKNPEKEADDVLSEKREKETFH